MSCLIIDKYLVNVFRVLFLIIRTFIEILVIVVDDDALCPWTMMISSVNLMVGWQEAYVVILDLETSLIRRSSEFWLLF